jgi:hypothetical protein
MRFLAGIFLLLSTEKFGCRRCGGYCLSGRESFMRFLAEIFLLMISESFGSRRGRDYC